MKATALAIGHHGEILQGTFQSAENRLQRGLITLPFPQKMSIAKVEISETPGISIFPPWKKKTLNAVQLFLKKQQKNVESLKLTVDSNIPVGFGLGSSTADIIAGIKATSRLLDVKLKPSKIFKLSVEAEKASDGTMFERSARLVGQREGKTLERFDKTLPAMNLLSINVAPDQPVDTLTNAPARYSLDELSEFSELRNLVRSAIELQDLRLLGEVATRSAIINQRHLAQPHFEALLSLCCHDHVHGLQVAHSGRMIGLMLDHELSRTDQRVADLQADLMELGLFGEFHQLNKKQSASK